MKKSLRILIALVLLLPVVSLLGLRVMALGSERGGEVGLAADGTLRDCPPKPNCVCSQAGDGAAEAEIAPLGFEGDGDAAWARLLTFVRAEPGMHVVSVDGDYAHVEAHTRFMNFVDDVEFLLDRQARAIHVRSASRVGYSDMGANRKRVESIRARWEG